MTDETNRDRVRRLLVHPLEAHGFRRDRKVTAERHAEWLLKLTDALGYLSDESLGVLLAMLKPKGQGKAHDVWPSRATIDHLAEAVHPRPVEEIPALRRWFASAAGSAAKEAGRLVEELHFFEKRKRPPLNPFEQKFIADQAAENDSRRRVAEDRQRRNVASAEDLAWLDWYARQRARAEALLSRDAA